jgi:type I restriction enzyme S subunit
MSNNINEQKAFGDYLVELTKSTIPASAAIDNGAYLFICSSSKPKRTDKWLQNKPAVIMGTGGVASVNYGKGEFSYSTDTWAFRSNSEDYSSEFPYRKIQQYLPRIDYAGFEGSGLRHLRKDFVKSLHADFPNPDAVQKITEILRVIDQVIEKTEALIEKYQQIKAGLMHDLFTRGVTADGKLRPTREQAPELYQKTPIGWIPCGWRLNTIRDLAHPSKGSTVIGPFGSDLVMSDYRTEGTPIVFVRDVKEGLFNWVSNVFISSQKTQALFSHRVKPGDILATKMGLPPCIAAVYPENMPLGIITADMIRMIPDRSKVNPIWLSTAINHDRSKRQVAAITAGVTRLKVTLADFRSLKIATPSPAEQELKVKLISSKEQLIAVEAQKLGKLKKQKSGLMHDLLTGKVPVTVSEPEEAHV